MNDDSHPSLEARDVGPGGLCPPAPPPTPTVLDHIRPTVVVRRRIWEPPPELRRPVAPAPTTEEPSLAEKDDAPPSSIFLAEGHGYGPVDPDAFGPDSLAADSLGPDSLDADSLGPDSLAPDTVRAPDTARAPATYPTPELGATEEPVVAAAAEEPAPRSLRIVPPAAAEPTVHVETSITVGELASALGRRTSELVAELVTNGFFEITAKTSLTREVARVAARAFGWQVDPPAPPVPSAEESAVAVARPVARRRQAPRRQTSARQGGKTTPPAKKKSTRRAAPTKTTSTKSKKRAA